MKGLIFNEFLAFVEQTMTYDMVDKIILKSNIESGGAYTSIGTYDPQEFFKLLTALSEETGTSKKQLLITYGEHLFGVFATDYPQFFKNSGSVFQFLCTVEAHVHAEVKKYYSDASFPHFRCKTVPPNTLIMEYRSPRHLADLAEGLIRGCIHFHQENIDIIRESMPVKQGEKAQFILTKREMQ